MVKIYMIEDHELIVEGLRSKLLTVGKNYSLVGSSKNIDQAIKEIQFEMPDIMILDPTLPKIDRIDNIRKLKKAFPFIPVIVYTMETSLSSKIQMFREGIWGYVSKDEDTRTLIETIENVFNGTILMPFEVKRVISAVKEEDDGNQLSKDDLDIMHHYSTGMCCKKIAEHHCKSLSLVEKSLKRIREKMDVETNEELLVKLLSPHYS